MLQEIETQLFTLTPAATQAVKDILIQRKLDGYALRVYVTSGGCCSVNFGMALDNNIRDVDTTFESNGVKVVVDEVSIDYLRNATVDFVNDPQRGAGFAVDSPNAKKEGGCGCGGHGHDSEASSCGCGGHGHDSEASSCGCGGGSCGCHN
ncbi:MAG: iron-sulfur cluster assembly accessory protein [Chloroflexi bacterium OLB14]|nr:MAG: iron-sulfur cluster assembly accessory protein [Chloroflexi bacterium OLB14]